MSNLEIASFICQKLLDIDIKTTLSGGFCVEIYSFGEYTSMDIDLIDQSVFKHNEIKKKMLTLGFVEEGKHFCHPDMKYTVEFPASPLAIGQELVKEISEIETQYGVLRLITPTDSVKDRLAAYFFWDDERSLEQAILVALKNDIDLENVRLWSEKERELEKFEYFLSEYRLRTITR
jgi:hypothetical protein